MKVPNTNLDKIIKEQEEIQGPEVIKLIHEVAEAIEIYGDAEMEGDRMEVPKEVSAPSPGRCFLCLSKFKENEKPVECEWCGRTYHKSCAHRVGRCPQCGDALDEKMDG